MSLREAAQQALEALEAMAEGAEDECGEPNCGDCRAWRPVWAAMASLRAALEQHEKDVEWMKQRHANWRLQKELAEQTQERDRQQREYEESRSAALEQEPVAWIDNSGHPHHIRYWQGVRERQLYGPLQPLYTHPPRREWRSLSEEEVNALWASHDKTGEQITRAIEAALKEKNHD